MSIKADPTALSACHLDDYAAAWAQRFMVPVARLARRDREADDDYLPRLLREVLELQAQRTC